MRLFFIGIASIGALVATGVVYSIVTYLSFTTQPLSLPKGSVLSVATGDGIYRVFNRLGEKGVLPDCGLFPSDACARLATKLHAEAISLHVGDYVIPSDVTPVGLIELLAESKVQLEAIRLPEGKTIREFLDLLRQSKHLVYDVTATDADSLALELGIPYSAEGWLHPDTYLVASGSSVKTLLETAWRQRHRHFQDLWDSRAIGLPIRTPVEAIVLASIVEKEAALAAERPQIAGVYMTRLRRKMTLDADPTLLYDRPKGISGPIRLSELRRDHPYNTYRNPGLPPTAICAPSKGSIEAVLHPKENGNVFFVARGDGSHYFSKTLREHLEAVNKYQTHD